MTSEAALHRMICPQRMDARAIRRHAGQLAMAFCYNDSFNCLAAKVVLIDEQWPQYEDFISCLKHILANVPAPASYCPEQKKRYQDFLMPTKKENISYPISNSAKVIGRSFSTMDLDTPEQEQSNIRLQ